METKIYIGSNNTTNLLELNKIESILNKYYKAYTIIPACGYWEGKKENTAIIEIINELVNDDVLTELKTELKQESLLITRQSLSILFF